MISVFTGWEVLLDKICVELSRSRVCHRASSTNLFLFRLILFYVILQYSLNKIVERPVVGCSNLFQVPQ